LSPHFTPSIKMKYKRIKGLKVSAKTTKFWNFHAGLGNMSLNMMPKAWTKNIRRKQIHWYFIKIKNCVLQRTSSRKGIEENFEKLYTWKGTCILKYIKYSYKEPNKYRQEDANRHFSKEDL
jgi:hypothetical protein